MEEYRWPISGERLQGRDWFDLRVNVDDLKVRWFQKSSNGHIKITAVKDTRYTRKVWHHWLNEDEQARFESSEYYKSAQLLPPSKKHPFGRYKAMHGDVSKFLDDALMDRDAFEQIRQETSYRYLNSLEPIRLNLCSGTLNLFYRLKGDLTVTGLIEGKNGFICLNYVHKEGQRYYKWLSPDEKEAFMKSHTEEEINKLKESANGLV